MFRIVFAVCIGMVLWCSSANAKTVRVTWVGDISFDRQSGLPPGGLTQALRPMKSLLVNDMVIGNLEGTLGSGGTTKCSSGSSNCYAFQAPTSYARGFRSVSFTHLNQANNHAYDAGAGGFSQTARSLRAAGIQRIGANSAITRTTVNGVRIASVGFSPYRWSSPLNDINAARRLVRRADRGADVVIVVIHAGAEGANKTHVPYRSEYAFGENRGNSRKFAHAVIDAGADAVLGSGPHVLRGIERYRDRIVAYSLGNFAGYRTLSTGGVSGLSGALRLNLDTRGRTTSGKLVSTQLSNVGLPRRDASNRAARLVARLSRSDFGTRRYRIHSNGGFVGYRP